MPVPQIFAQARCLCHKYLHRQDACATNIIVGWARSPPQTICTGKMPVPQILLWGGLEARPNYLHRQDACATKILVGWASCPPQIFEIS
ncbi:hypothetical protein QT987_06775 [Microcoleus sp. SVA1B4]